MDLLKFLRTSNILSHITSWFDTFSLVKLIWFIFSLTKEIANKICGYFLNTN
jgi:hypothetical protein